MSANLFSKVLRDSQVNPNYRYYLLISAICAVFLLNGCAGTEKVEQKPVKRAYHVRELPWPPPIFDFSPESEPFMLEEVNYKKSLPSHIPNSMIVINKERRRLNLYSGMRLIKSYPISLGFDPENDKEKEGDGRTPEGIFYVCSKNPASSFFLSLGISYPNIEDAERGLREGIITKAQYNKIVHAMKREARPPWFTGLGGAIFIHGGGVDWDWTAGCIAMENRHIRELFRAVSVGTPVIIEKSSGIRYSQNVLFYNRLHTRYRR